MSTATGLRRRIAQYSLRGMLILMLVFGCVFGWLSTRKRAHEIVRRLRDEGASVTFAHQHEATTEPSPLSVAITRWAQRVVGENAFRTPVTLFVSHSLSADALQSIRHLRRLERVFVNNSNINDQTLTYLARSDRLKTLYCGGTEITDAGITALAQAQNLQSLVVWDSKITDASLKIIRALPNLTVLCLQQTAVTDQGVSELMNGLQAQLCELDLSGTNATGACLPSLRGASDLERLRLRDLPINDEQIRPLMELPKLRRLDLSGTRITPRGLAELKTALPNCEILARDTDRK